MTVQELYHGAIAKNIIGIMKEGSLRPNTGVIYFGRHESQCHHLFQYGADRSRSCAFVIRVRVHIPEGHSLKPWSGPGVPSDAWILETQSPVKAEVLELFVRTRPGDPIQRFKGKDIGQYLRPKEFRLVVTRKHISRHSIIGELSVDGGFICYTLELPWRRNQKEISCVPPGEYRGHLRFDHKDRWRIELLNVPGHRENIQIHIGNVPKDVHGCVLVGTAYQADQVLNSAAAYEKLKAAYREHAGHIIVKFHGALAASKKA